MSESHDVVADALAGAPAWARLALGFGNDRQRTAAVNELARHITAPLTGEVGHDPRQLGLPL